MSGKPFRELLDLSGAVELIGRRLYGETWTGLEYASQPRKSPEEIASERKPLEDELSAAEAEIQRFDAAIQKSIDAAENERLARLRGKLETRMRHLHTALSFDHSLNDCVIEAYDAHVRWQTARETLLEAIRNRSLTVHDGRGRELNSGVWSHPKFRYHLDLSIVINPRMSGEPRRQAARIDRDRFENWLLTLKQIVEPPPEPPRESSPEQQVTEYLQQQIAAAEGGPHKSKGALRKEAVAKIQGATGRMFDRIWQNVVPSDWRESGAPRRSRSRR